jgi:hypothetical protein
MGQKITLDNIKSLVESNTKFYSDTPSFWESDIRILTSDISFLLSNGKTLTVERGFEWDEVSVPYIFQWAFPKSGKYALSALVHDALYYKKYNSRKFADDEFKKWMDVTINANQSWIRWAFVRAFGWTYWNKKPSKRLIYNQQFIKIKH